MKTLLFSVCFLILTFSGFAQQLQGVIHDEGTRSPIVGVQVIHKNQVVLSNATGAFILANIKEGDQVSFRLMGYETRELTIKALDLKTQLTIELRTTTISLTAVNIRSKRNSKLDSLRLRKEFAAIFNYKGPKLTDMFVKINPEERVPLALVKPPSTSSIFTFNALQAISLFGQKKKQTSTLKSTLLAAEAATYVGQRFSKSKVQELTALQGDSLSLFLERFKPSASELKQLNDYQLSIYIKSKYAEFIKP